MESALEGTQHGPDLVVVDHLDQLVAGCAPDGAVVVDLQAERLAAVTAARVGFGDGQLRAVQHGLAQGLVLMILDAGQEPDGHFVDIGRAWALSRRARRRYIPASWCSSRNRAR